MAKDATGLNSFVDSLNQTIQQDKALKLQQAQNLINSGAYAPVTGQQPSILGRISGNLFGPQAGSPNMNISGQNYQFQTPEIKQATALKNLLGQMQMIQTANQQTQQPQQPNASGMLGSTGVTPSGGSAMFKPEYNFDSSGNVTMKASQQDPLVQQKNQLEVQKLQQDLNGGPNGVGDISNKTPEMIQQEMKQKNPAYANYLKSIAEGRFTLGGRSTKQISAIQKDLSTMYPDFDQSKINARYKTRQDFTTGLAAKNIKSLNTAIGHLDEFRKLVPQLNNSNIKLINQAGQTFARDFGGGKPAATLAKFNAVKNALSGELSTIYKNTGGTDQEIKHVMDSFDSADSPDSLNAAGDEIMSLMGSRTSALQDQWHNAFDRSDDNDFPVLSTKSKSLLSSMGYDNENNTVKNTSQKDASVDSFQSTPSGLKYRIIQ